MQMVQLEDRPHDLLSGNKAGQVIEVSMGKHFGLKCQWGNNLATIILLVLIVIEIKS